MTELPSHKNNQNAIYSEDETYSPYAGVMKRAIASCIDIVLLTFLLAALYAPFLLYFSPISLSLINNPEHRLEFLQSSQSLPVILGTHLLFFFYFTLQYRSKHQATLGMRLVDINLTTEEAQKPPWTSLSLRYFLYILPALSLIFLKKSNIIPIDLQEANLSLTPLTTVVLILMIALTNRKQTYYDMAAKTLVMQEPKESNPPYTYAGLGRRFFADLVDRLIFIALMALIITLLSKFLPTSIASSLYKHPAAIIIGTLFLAPLAYSIPQLRSKHQATLGMRLLNIKIMTTNYQKPSIKKLFSRYCLFFFLYPLSMGELIPAAMILFTDRKQAHYDKMSKIIFVKTSE